MHHRDATFARLLWVGRRKQLPVDADGAGVRRFDSTEDSHQGRLARTIFSDQCSHLSRIDTKVGAAERHRRSEGLIDTFHLQ